MSDIILKNIEKSFEGKEVLKNFNAVFPARRVSCIMGSSGCGKTTLLNILLGLQSADGGSVEGLPDRITALFQEDRLCEDFSAESNVRLTAARGVTREDIAKALAELGLESDIKTPVRELSGGMKRRVAIARTMLAEGGLVIMDEPFRGLDGENRRRAAEFDGFIFGCPVYYAHPSARLLAVMDRAFYSNGKNFAFKPAAAISSARRNGQVATMDVINKHFSISQMPIVSSNYWNHIFAAEPEEVVQDEEGVQTMINLAANMAWLLKCIELGKQNGIDHPNNPKIATNFTRR